ncbi:hypothetical protein DFA_08816 [Cavenderia fasciculata]|uniref:ComC supersandwich domain-containing protein n=1 Tax=Cavenderia fasciculata TaxID=261658 RepID=F4Q4G6_CACFS|nr:uncharacterized protein DFA_08816 [Cavenderia fasciculata]EGG17815.1 hypothetical protein DFA_08816 [Cavenderia fasciculata]|eukprot:XP_004356299.1 hypothetical protein DFA_08816 [Cavenderia fasciculata]
MQRKKNTRLAFEGSEHYIFFKATSLIPSSELASIQFLIQQYGQIHLPQDQSICNGSFTEFITCQLDIGTGEDHFTSLKMTKPFSPDLGFPDYNILKFDFPKLTTLVIYQTGNVKNTTLNILDRLTDLPLLGMVFITKDYSIDSIPIGFPKNLPNLKIFSIIDSIQKLNFQGFFNNSNIEGLSLSGVRFSSFALDSSYYLPRLKQLDLHIIVDTPISIDMQSSSFPSIQSLSIKTFGSKSNINLNMQSLWELYIDNDVSLSSLSLGNLKNLNTIDLNGQTTIAGNMTNLLGLDKATININSLTTYPFSMFPPNLSTFIMRNSSCLLIPTIPLPPSLLSFELSNNLLLAGSVPFSTIFGDSRPNFKVDLSFNPNLNVGIVPNNWCEYGGVNLQNTMVSSVPDCFLCYYGNGDPNILVPIIPPQNFVCNITFTSLNLFSSMGKFNLIGNLIGFGYPNAQALVPNRALVYNVPNNQYIVGPPRDYNISFYSMGGKNVTFSMVEVYFSVANATVVGNVNRQLVLEFSYFNSYLPHFVQFNQGTVNCTSINQNATHLVCSIPNSLVLEPTFMYNLRNEIIQFNLEATYEPKDNPPIVTSTDYSMETQTLELYGTFGPLFNFPLIIKVSNLTCRIVTSSVSLMKCELDTVPKPGPATLFVSIGGFDFISSSLLYFQPNSDNSGSSTTTTTSSTTGGSKETPQQICSRLTYNCYGHGQCDNNGICQCNENYNQIDNCLTKYINTTIKPNTTNPTVSFDIDGIDFQFEIYSIQELDYDGSILQELLLTNQTWNVSINTDNITTFANYQLFLGNDSIYETLLVSSDLSFSSIGRNVIFGDTELVLVPNAIKVGFSISNWQYQSNVATLRAVFKSIINNNQTISVDCDNQQQSIDSFTKDQLSESIQYLRVVKDNIQFNGRFIDFVLSDGRKTYSKTELISLTPTNNDQSIALIGINLPQCKSCQLDPDFTPLIIEKNNDNCSSPSKTWRIIVGVVVGGVAVAAVAIGTIILIKKKVAKKHYESKLNKLNVN